MAATTPTTSTLSYDVPGMSCDHCRKAIEDRVDDVSGVDHVHVDVDAGQVTVRGRELAEQVVRDAILMAGYDAYLRSA